MNVQPSLLLRVLLFFTMIFPFASKGQIAQNDPLFQELLVLDDILFEKGFNQCELEAMRPHIAENLTFYHDTAGPTYASKDFFTAVENNICASPDRKPIRKRIDSSMEVFPLYQQGTLYGAIQKGIHEFFIKEPGKELYKTNIARFTHVWLKKDDLWVLETVLSYDHQEP